MGDPREARSDFQSGGATVPPPASTKSHFSQHRGQKQPRTCTGAELLQLILLVLFPPQLPGAPAKGPTCSTASRGDRRAAPVGLSVKYCHFWLVKLIIAAETLPCPAEGEESPSKFLHAMKVPSRSHTWDVHHEVLLQSKQPRKSNCSNMWVASCKLLFLAFIFSWRFP